MRFFPFLRLAGPLSLGLLLTACQSNPTNQAATTNPADSAVFPAAPAAPTNDADTWYRQYRGLLPGTSADSVTLHLQQLRAAPGSEVSANQLAGFYTFAAGRPYELMGETSGRGDSLYLREVGLSPFSGDGEPGTVTEPAWELKLDGNRLVGTRNDQPVQLRLLRQNGVQFAARHFAADVLPRSGHPEDSIVGHYALRALVPFGTPHAAALAAGIGRGLRGASLNTAPVPPLDSLWRQQLRRFSRDYREAVGPLLAQPPMGSDEEYRPSQSLGYVQEATVYVLWNEGNLLSLGYFSYEFSGGAHGNYGTMVRSYDTRTGRWLSYNAIFQPAAGPRLEKLLGRYVRPAMGLAANAPLSETLLVDSVPITRNVYLTSGGAVFVYQPYEIAAYVYGQISVFVPFSELSGLLQPGLPVSPSPAVATR